MFVQLADLNVAKNDTSRDGKRCFPTKNSIVEKLKRERIETPVSSDQKESCGSVDDGYVRLAAEILRSEFSAYRRALEKYDGSRNLSVEFGRLSVKFLRRTTLH